jgi:hypothetical protein
MRRLVVAASVLVIVCVLGLAVFGAQQLAAQSRGGGNTWWETERAREALDLSGEQTVAVTALNDAYLGQLRDVRPEIAKAMQGLITALDDPEVAPEKIADRRRELERAWGSFATVTMDHWESLRGELSTEQWLELPTAAPGALRMGMVTVRMRQMRSGQ